LPVLDVADHLRELARPEDEPVAKEKLSVKMPVVLRDRLSEPALIESH